jgi:hypothetical protein
MDSLDLWKKEIEDALTVMGGLQARQGRVLADHSEWLQAHDRAMAQFDERIEKLVAAGTATDERIEKLVSAIGEFVRRNE